jgi:hypothetical protein
VEYKKPGAAAVSAAKKTTMNEQEKITRAMNSMIFYLDPEELEKFSELERIEKETSAEMATADRARLVTTTADGVERRDQSGRRSTH